TRQQDGVLPSHKHFFVDCTVLFSEEEKAIIRARGLGRHYIEVGADTAPPRSWHEPLARFLKVGAPLLFLAGCTTGMGMSLAGNRSGDALTGCSFFLAIGMFLGGIALRRHVHVAGQLTQTVTLSRLMGNPSFCVWAFDNASAKTTDLDIRAALERVKTGLLANAEIEQPEHFEL